MKTYNAVEAIRLLKEWGFIEKRQNSTSHKIFIRERKDGKKDMISLPITNGKKLNKMLWQRELKKLERV